MTRAAAATTPNTHTHTSYTWTKICKQKAIACPSLRFAAHLIFSCHVPPGLNLAQRWKQPGAEVEADAHAKCSVHTKAMSCFPTTHSPGCKVHWCDPCLTSGPGMSTGTFQKRQFRTRVSVARMCRQGCECVDEPDLYTQSARINTADGLEHGDRTPYGYFKMFYPMAHLAKTLELTSAKLRKAGHRALTKQEFFVFVGVLIGTALFPKQSRRQLFTPAERQRHRYMSTHSEHVAVYAAFPLRSNFVLLDIQQHPISGPMLLENSAACRRFQRPAPACRRPRKSYLRR